MFYKSFCKLLIDSSSNKADQLIIASDGNDYCLLQDFNSDYDHDYLQGTDSIHADITKCYPGLQLQLYKYIIGN